VSAMILKSIDKEMYVVLGYRGENFVSLMSLWVEMSLEVVNPGHLVQSIVLLCLCG
jgi:hypothetical protein